MTIFHLAIPTDSLEKTKQFYHEILGAKIGREYKDYVVFDFYGHQLVTHYCPEQISQNVSMYPRHFGIILDDKKEFDRVYENCRQKKVNFYKTLFERFREKQGWHNSFFIIDPSNNLIEIKYYINKSDIF